VKTPGSGTSLTGVWTGRYAYPRALAPVPFLATLIEFGGNFTGSIHEPDDTGTGAVAYASIEGLRQGNEVTFTKVYDNAVSQHDLPIRYSGQLNSDATEIKGRWMIPGHWSGDFVMLRELRKEKTKKRKATERL